MSGSALITQWRVIFALVLRETRATFGSSHAGYLWAIATPAIGTGLLAFIFSLVDRQAPYGSSLALFFATGLLTLELFNKMSTSLMTAIEANQSLFSYPAVKPVDALYARTVLIAATHLLIMALFYGCLILLDLAWIPEDPLALIGAISSTVLLGFGFGTLNSALVTMWDAWRHVEKILTRPLVFVSGVFYVPGMLPPEAQAVLWWNPVLHLIEWTRDGFWAGYDSTIATPAMPLVTALILIFCGLGLERLLQKGRTT